MTCFHPIEAFQSEKGAKVTFARQNMADANLQLPCGQCIGCKLVRSDMWATRIMHESSMHNENCWITLTYREEDVPHDLSLDKSHFQKFIRRLRKGTGHKIRYFHAGEYGEKYLRPHYHAILLGYFPHDAELIKSEEGLNTYSSYTIEKYWQLGGIEVCDLSRYGANYVAKYCQKKITGPKADTINPDTGLKHYERFHAHTGEIITVQPEYMTCSLKPGIGQKWFEQFKSDCYPSDFITHKGKKHRVPKYYDKLLEAEDPELLEAIQALRAEKSKKHAKDQTRERLATREICAHAKLEKQQRTLE